MFVYSFFLLLIAYKVESKLPAIRREQIIPVVLLGLTGIFAYNVCFFKGLKTISAGRAAVIVANNPIFIALLSSYFFKEKLGLVKIAGIITSVVGAVIVISHGHLTEVLAGNIGWGEFYIFCCVFSWVAFSLIGKTVLRDLSPLISVSYASAIGALSLFIPACFEGIVGDFLHYSGLEWLAIFYLGFFGTVLGFVWYYEGIRNIGPMKASQFINFVPISAVILAFLLLEEALTASLIIGTILVCSGVYLTNRTYGIKRI